MRGENKMPDLQPISRRCTRCGRAMITVDEGGFSSERCLECPLPNAEGNTVHPSWQPVLAKKMADFDQRHPAQPAAPQPSTATPVAQPSLPAAPTAGMKYEDCVKMAIGWLKSAPMPPSRKAYSALDKAIKSLEKSLEQ